MSLRPGHVTSNLGADDLTFIDPPFQINLDYPEAPHMEILNENSERFDIIVQQARCYVPGHLGDAREWYGIDRDDHGYFNAETGRGGCDDDILDTVRDDVFGDLLNDPDHEYVAAESLSDAASQAVHAYVLDEKLGRL